MPRELLAPSVAVEKRALLMVDVGMRLFARNLSEPFHLVVLNIGATNFVADAAAGSAGDIRSFLTGRSRDERALQVVSKRDARARRESFKAMAPPPAPHATNLSSEGGGRAAASSAGREYEEDEYPVSNSDEDESGDLALQLRAPAPRQSVKSRMEGAMPLHCKSTQSSVDEQVQLLKSSSKGPISSSPADAGLSCGAPESSQASLRSNPVRPESIVTNCSELDGLTVLPDAQRASESAGPDHYRTVRNAAGNQSVLAGTNFERVSSSFDTEGEGSGVSAAAAAIERETAVSARSEDGGRQIDSTGWRVCGECGATVEQTERGRQEHADYHFAQSLDRRERRSPLSGGAAGGPTASRDDDSLHSRRRLAQDTPRKKPKAKNGTLDGFVRRY